MEDRFQDGLQVPLDDFLGNPVRDRRNPQWSGFCLAIALRNIDPPNRWRKCLPESQSVPELVEVVRKSSLKVRNDCPSTHRPWLAFTFLKAAIARPPAWTQD